jgi:5-methyltetrahydrofolate--homocysteine methyltransferase
MVRILADRLAEALSERLHERVCKELWGYVPREALSNDELVDEKYTGVRPAPGYPAYPNHTEERLLWSLLEVEELIGVQVTESCAMLPAASVSGFYFDYPRSNYFGVGRIDRDQVHDYTRRKGMSVVEVEPWLGPNLAYSPAADMTDQ